ncbi:MAG: polyprenyl synthetase family protein [Clostridia bacterium]
MSEPKIAPGGLGDPFQTVADDLRVVDLRLGEVLRQENAMVQRVADHLLAASGKRVRPSLVILAARAAATDQPPPIAVAVAVELIHMATLVHDDIVDRGEVRRGLPALRTAFSDQVAVLAGDFLFARAFELLAATGQPKVVELAANVVHVMCVGEIQETLEVGQMPTEAEYLRRIDGKTAHFLAASCRLGALAVKAPPSVREALTEYGQHVGMAFQIYDDLLDLIADPMKLGKAVASDFRQGVVTLPVVYALERWPHPEELVEALRSHEDSGRKAALDILAKTGAIEDTERMAEAHVAEATRALLALPKSPSRDSLEQLAGFVVSRAY